MGKHTIFVMLALTLVWMLLLEQISWQSAAMGMFFSMLCMHVTDKFLNLEEIRKVDFFKLAGYPLWLVMRIYMDALFLIKTIITGAKWGIIRQEMTLENESLRTILSESITLTPGSVYLERDEKEITLLCIGSKREADFPASRKGLHDIEAILLKAQKE